MSQWNLVILHYHLNPGGVTRVISGHLEALASLPYELQPQRVFLCYDGQSEGWPCELGGESRRFSIEPVVVPSLRYDTGPCQEPEFLAGDLQEAWEAAGIAVEDVVVHVHNHNLGKNAALPGALQHLAARGYRLLLQIHDFAEDMRPVNYRHMADCYGGVDRVSAQIYFSADHVHYAVLNGRDARMLQRAGLSAERLHSLPNPVSKPASVGSRRDAREALVERWPFVRDRCLLVYPVRGIRRKNVGELLLWAAALGDSAFFAMTLPPRNPIELPVYRAWEALAAELELPVDLAAATRPGIRFEELVAAADWEITTSVAEGFGLVFLESWLASKPLTGRDLPEITVDFKEAGVVFPDLQPEVAIPWDWLDRNEVADHLRRHYQNVLDAYGIDRAAEETERELDEVLAGPVLDWAYLDFELQQRLLRDCTRDGGRWSDFWDANPKLGAWRSRLSGSTEMEELVRANTETIERAFGLHACGRRLYDIYARLLVTRPVVSVEPLPDAAAVLRSFLQLDRLHPIRLA